ncbi:hypothetical protein HII17_17345 [Thalassotalea sp. M1531]|uniref:Solute-binding protein family 3/N-terminal domain-containing protein n=1 Tax=Thalassotalea algicola TaxID=2716224 RepID=A0A7Y0LFK9_9GAMM|nr:hypothetical protein [Thalassotalea algicola]NMP33322.1 hypothetical protein [Thalassotalea algicola]
MSPKLTIFLISIFFSQAVLAEKKVFLVGVEDVDYYPLFSFDSKGPIRPSFAHDVLKAFFDHHNLPFKFVPLPIKRFDKWYLEHNIDFKFPDNFRWRNDFSNKLGITFSEPLLKLMAGTYVLKSNAGLNRRDITSISTVRGFFPTLWLKEVTDKKVHLIEESKPLAVVRHVIDGNSLATNIDLNVINNYLRAIGKEGEIILADGIYHQEYHYHFSSIQYPEIIKKFNQFLVNQKVLVDKIKRKYHLKE